MNACLYCKNGKRKCTKTRPSCGNCLRLGKTCVYLEDTINTTYQDTSESTQTLQPNTGESNQGTTNELPGLFHTDSPYGIDPFSHDALRQPTVDLVVRTQALRILGSFEKMFSISAEFFIGTYQRFPTLSRSRFNRNLQSLRKGPRADFLVLCLCIHLVQQLPPENVVSMQSSLYVTVKYLIGLLEATSSISLDVVQCRILVTMYEMGHGLDAAAYISIASCARAARAIGLHQKPWRQANTKAIRVIMEEQKRMWWAIVNMDRFINLYTGNASFVAEDPEQSDPLPVEDLLWSEDSSLIQLEGSIIAIPVLGTAVNITVGQMARECQVTHLAGRVARHIFDPTPDPNFNAEEAAQLERTLISFLPLLCSEELKMGKYCASLAICHSALFILHDFMLGRTPDNSAETHRILQAFKENADRARSIVDSAFADKENFYLDTLSPYFPLSLFQAAIVEYRLWKQNAEIIHKKNFDTLVLYVKTLAGRWRCAEKYLEILSNIQKDWPTLMLPNLVSNLSISIS